MKKQVLTILAIGMMVGLFPSLAFASGFTLPLDEGTYVTLGFRVQAAAVMAGNQAGAANGDAAKGGTHYDAFARRVQVLAAGQVTPMMNFMVMLEHKGYGKDYSAGTGLQTADAWAQLNFSDMFRVMGGVIIPPFSRNQLTPTAFFIGADRPVVEEVMLESPGMFEKRDRGICLWGNINAFQYRYAFLKGGQSQVPGEEKLRTTWRIHYAMLDQDASYYYKETEQGRRNIFTVGYAVDSQEDVSAGADGKPAKYRAWTADMLMEGGGEGGVMTILYAYSSYKWGNEASVTTDGLFRQGEGWSGTLAYMETPGRELVTGMQPYIRYAVWDAASTAVGARQKRTAYGFNYYLKGHDAKVTLEFEQVSFASEGNTHDLKNHGVTTAQFQVAF